MVDAVSQTDLCQGLERHSFAFLVGEAGINQRQFDVAQRVGARQEVERLENETDFLVPNPGELVVIHLADVNTIQLVEARSRGVQTTQEIHQS